MSSTSKPVHTYRQELLIRYNLILNRLQIYVTSLPQVTKLLNEYKFSFKFYKPICVVDSSGAEAAAATLEAAASSDDKDGS